MKIARLEVNCENVYAEKKNGKYFLIEGDVFSSFNVTDKEVSGKILYPVLPSKIVALGANYPKHVSELNEKVLNQKYAEKKDPLIFLKPPTSLISFGENIVLPKGSENVHYEGELAVVIGKTCKKVAVDAAKDYIFGYTIANDVSDRIIQNKDVQWTRAKGFDTFCPLGDCIETEVDGQNLHQTTKLNGKTVQDGNTADMICKIDEAVSFISNVMTLLPGDLILMGTPEGVDKLSDGDVCEIEIEGVGTLRNSVVDEL